MNVIYWGEPDLGEMDESPDLEYESDEPFADDDRPELQLQLVSDTLDADGAEDEAFVSRWLAERQCSGV